MHVATQHIAGTTPAYNELTDLLDNPTFPLHSRVGPADHAVCSELIAYIQTLHKPRTCRATSAAPTLCMQHQVSAGSSNTEVCR
jgi:hypothetical protein